MIKKEHYFIIGGGSLQLEFLRCVKENGFITHCFDYDPNCICKNECDFFHLISIGEKEKILELAKFYNIVGIGTTATELGNITVCYVGQNLGLATNSYETALNTTDKSRMKKIFTKFNIPTANYIEISNETEFEELLNKMGGGITEFPLVVKPSDRSAGRGVKKVNNISELKIAYKVAKDFATNGIVLIEEVLKGRQFSVETISSNKEHKIVAITEEYLRKGYYKNDFLETQQLIPARISKARHQDIEYQIIKILDAFEIKFGACHIELKLDINGVKIIEIASRMGGWRNVLVKNSYDIDYNYLLLKASLGRKLDDIKCDAKNFCLVKIIFTQKDYNFYLHVKQRYPQMIINDNVFITNETKFDYSSDLLDAKGYYYIKIPSTDNPSKFIKGIITESNPKITAKSSH
ncbi:ATP-grasp domain-containing protein [Campylobacter hyointestinalis]|uniref:ATP-grasp domain-containing protein n=1 Tax=Campylobacter hyointestinalis TaxID=198 RepID=UPI000CE30B05|nr:ATP-grasp domain-containing protein [Campylobacter hyointestinalis]PPB64675.1 carboxylate--amine ligase [Campylobacter hyointestinalis subsp. hyointestinalis]